MSTVPDWSKARPLVGHVSAETAFVVDDYPYGFRLRCRIRYWLESGGKKGVRFVSQTTNPKVPGVVWNKPKASTYVAAAAMYLDEQGHVQWASIGEYHSEPERIAAFVRAFPSMADNPFVSALCKFGVARYRKLASGEAQMVTTINGVEQTRSDDERAAERAKYAVTLAAWEAASAVLVDVKSPTTLATE